MLWWCFGGTSVGELIKIDGILNKDTRKCYRKMQFHVEYEYWATAFLSSTIITQNVVANIWTRLNDKVIFQL